MLDSKGGGKMKLKGASGKYGVNKAVNGLDLEEIIPPDNLIHYQAGLLTGEFLFYADKGQEILLVLTAGKFIQGQHL